MSLLTGAADTIMVKHDSRMTFKNGILKRRKEINMILKLSPTGWEECPLRPLRVDSMKHSEGAMTYALLREPNNQ